MFARRIVYLMFGIGIVLTGCGAPETTKVPGDELEAIKTIEGREIIAELEQTTQNTSKRNQKINEVIDQDDFKKGMFGEPTSDLEEMLAIQGIEGIAAIQALEKVYGGYDGVAEVGVQFYEWKSDGAEQSGVWIGIKNPDEKLDELIRTLQKQVDNGEILAKPIYFYKSPHTENEINTLTSTVFSSLERVGRLHEKPDAISATASVNTISGIIEIGHNFITEEQKKILQNEYADYEIEFKQEGRLVPIGNETDIVYPASKTTTTKSAVGSYIVSVDNDGMLIVDAGSMNFGTRGGDDEFYGAVRVTYLDAAKKLEVGQRVLVEYSGGIMLSYPGQGRAIFVEVLPDYQPVNALLSESQVVRQALSKSTSESHEVPVIRDFQFIEDSSIWNVQIKIGEESYEIEVEDK